MKDTIPKPSGYVARPSGHRARFDVCPIFVWSLTEHIIRSAHRRRLQTDPLLRRSEGASFYHQLRFTNKGIYGVVADDYSRFSVKGSGAPGNGTAGFIAGEFRGRRDEHHLQFNGYEQFDSDKWRWGGPKGRSHPCLGRSSLRCCDMSNFPNGMVSASNGSLFPSDANANSGNRAPNSTIWVR
jgi:hypothetical protein